MEKARKLSRPQEAVNNSKLSQRLGPEVVNYFSGSPLNRLSFLRPDYTFLSSAFVHPSAVFLLLQNLAPLTQDTDNPSHLAYVANADVLPLTGHDPFKGTEDELVRTFNSEEERSLVVFLGIDEKDDDCEQAFTYKGFTGVPYFAIDATPRASIAEAAKCVTATLKERGFAFFTRPKYMGYNPRDGCDLPSVHLFSYRLCYLHLCCGHSCHLRRGPHYG